MTNYEKIKNMSVEEMAKFIFTLNEDNCSNYCKKAKCGVFGTNCKEGIKQWLNSEVKK